MTINLTPATMAVRGALDDTLWQTLRQVASRVGIGEATARRHLRTLVDIGEAERNHISNTYRKAGTK